MGKGTYDNPAADTVNPDGYNQQSKYNPSPDYGAPQGYSSYQQTPGQTGPNVVQMQPYNPAGGVPYTPGGASHTVILQQAEERYSLIGHIAFSCAVFWCCNCLFGAIAFFVALSGQNERAEIARKKGRISMILNIVGIAITCILVAVMLGLYFGLGLWQYQTYDYYNNYYNNNFNTG